MASVAGPRPPCGVHSAVPSSGSGRLVSSASSVQPVRCPVTRVRRPGPGVRTDGVHPSGVPPAAVHPVRPDASVSSHPRRWRWGPGRCGGAPCPQERVEVPVGGRALQWLGRGPSRPGRGRGCRDRAWVSRCRWRTRAGPGAGGRRPRLPAERPGRPGRRAERPSLAAALWAREQAPARGCCTGRVAGVPGLGGRPRWVVVMGPAARVGGSGRTDGRADGDGRAAPARPRQPASAPESLPAAL
jgi:hypothetical protein